MEGEDKTTGNTFESLKIWRTKLQKDLEEHPQSSTENFRLRLLLEQGKDCEQAVFGCLKEAIFDLNEGVAWGLYPSHHADAQRQLLYNQATIELVNDKNLCLELAREHGIFEQYAAALMKPDNSTLADYEHINELKFALLVWRANLLRDVPLAKGHGGNKELKGMVKQAYEAALRLIKRCARQSELFWSRTQHAADPSELNVEEVWRHGSDKVKCILTEIVQQHRVDDAENFLFQLFNKASQKEDISRIQDEIIHDEEVVC